ncbi:MAG: PspC domain-containing protein [Anaerolineae bacterium]|nr:PspC domain-containing protein [Anaerolineae bacterium]
MHTSFYRSSTDRMIGGVCGGLADYLHIDATFIRLFFILLALGNGMGVTIYLILWLIMPDESRAGSTIQQNVRAGIGEMTARAGDIGHDLRHLSPPDQQIIMLIGSALIIMGVFWLVDNILSHLDITWLWWFNSDTLWPVLLIAGGIVLLVRYLRSSKDNT